MPGHPTRDCYTAFFATRLPPAERNAVLAHLLHGCAACAAELTAVTAALFRPGLADAPGNGWEYEFPISRAIKRALREAKELERGRQEAAGEIAALLQSGARPTLGSFASLGRTDETPPGPVGATGPEYRRGWAWCEQFLTESRALLREDPATAVLLASLGVTLAEARLRADGFPPRQLTDLRARARAELANARRVAQDFAAAEDDMLRAVAHAERGTGDPMLLARLMDLSASLYRDQRRFVEARALLDAAETIYRQHGENHLAGRALVSQGLVFGVENEPLAAVQRIEQGIALLDPAREPALLFTAVHSLIWFLVEAGQPETAGRLIRTSGSLYAAFAGAVDRSKLRWMEGRIAASQGAFGEAVAALTAARQELAGHGLPGDVALVSLDLAAVYLQLGRPGEIGRLVAETLAVFRTLGIRREAIAAFLLLEEAVAAERATLALCAEVAAQIRRLDWATRDGGQDAG